MGSAAHSKKAQEMADNVIPLFTQRSEDMTAQTTDLTSRESETKLEADGPEASSPIPDQLPILTPLEYIGELVQIAEMLGQENSLLQYERDELKARIQHREEQIQTLDAEGADLRREQEWQAYQRDRYAEERDHAIAERDTLIHVMESLVRVLREARGNFSTLRALVGELQHTRARLTNESRHLAHQNAALSQLAQDLAESNRELLTEQEQSRRDCEILASLVQEATQSLHGAREHLVDLGNELRESQAENAVLRRAVTESASTLARSNNDVAVLHAMLANLKDSIEYVASSPLAFAIRSRLRALLAV
jgi:chromosome segregation ATPase